MFISSARSALKKLESRLQKSNTFTATRERSQKKITHPAGGLSCVLFVSIISCKPRLISDDHERMGFCVNYVFRSTCSEKVSRLPSAYLLRDHQVISLSLSPCFICDMSDPSRHHSLILSVHSSIHTEETDSEQVTEMKSGRSSLWLLADEDNGSLCGPKSASTFSPLTSKITLKTLFGGDVRQASCFSTFCASGVVRVFLFEASMSCVKAYCVFGGFTLLPPSNFSLQPSRGLRLTGFNHA